MSYPPAASVGRLTASKLDGYRHLGTYKTGDTSRNSGGTGTTLTADPHLTIAVEANGVYAVRYRLVQTSDATPDFKWDMTAPAGATMLNYTYLAWGAASAHDYGTLAGLSTVGVAIGDGTPRPLNIDGTLVVSATPGNLVLRWAQNTSSANNTTLKAGSSVTLIRLV